MVFGGFFGSSSEENNKVGGDGDLTAAVALANDGARYERSSNVDFYVDAATGNMTNLSDTTVLSDHMAKSDAYNSFSKHGSGTDDRLDPSRSEHARRKKEELAKGRFLARRGLFAANELSDETLFNVGKKLPDRQGSKRFHSLDSHYLDVNDIGNQDRHCILRLPENIANLVKRRMQDNTEIGMLIEPTGRYDYREYKITINGIDEPLIGILGELPCIVEAHKTLDCDLLFKSADISQMMIAYDPETAEQVAQQLMTQKMWEWPDGLTPPTRNIRTRKFKNFEVYTNEDVKDAEREALVLLNGLVRDSYHFEIKSAHEVKELVESYRNGNIKERIIGPDEDVSDYIAALEQQEADLAGDLSEVMFGGEAIGFLSQQNSKNYL
ncbi:bifunctional TAFII55 protein [Babesia duncani]|uniref:Bifunctional TAFII55 protein n=1 Tax=Babesia duncani TaxID=323732 RepID=A0AAD9PIZ3_9APIC|nr:bifunctional TAFII55 protein [Babesia duncani]